MELSYSETRLSPQLPHHLGNVVLLKKPDRANTSRARIHTVASVLERNATQGKDRDLLPASFTQSIEATSASLRLAFLFKDWCEHGDVRPFIRGTSNVGCGMTRNTDQGGMSYMGPNLPRFRWRNIVRPQMLPVSAAGYGNVTS